MYLSGCCTIVVSSLVFVVHKKLLLFITNGLARVERVVIGSDVVIFVDSAAVHIEHYLPQPSSGLGPEWEPRACLICAGGDFSICLSRLLLFQVVIPELMNKCL